MKHRTKSGIKPENKSGSKKKSNKIKYKCNYCDKVGPKAADCFAKKKSTGQKANVIEEAFLTEGHDHNLSLMVNTNTKNNSLDSGCTSHLCKDNLIFTDIKMTESGLKLASSATTLVKVRSDVRVIASVGNADKPITLQNTLYVPDLRTNLISVAKIVDKKNKVIFNERQAIIQDLQENTKMIARQGDLFYLREESEQTNAATSAHLSEAKVWHDRLGYLITKDMELMLNNRNVIGMKFKDTWIRVRVRFASPGS